MAKFCCPIKCVSVRPEHPRTGLYQLLNPDLWKHFLDTVLEDIIPCMGPATLLSLLSNEFAFSPDGAINIWALVNRVYFLWSQWRVQGISLITLISLTITAALSAPALSGNCKLVFTLFLSTLTLVTSLLSHWPEWEEWKLTYLQSSSTKQVSPFLSIWPPLSHQYLGKMQPDSLPGEPIACIPLVNRILVPLWNLMSWASTPHFSWRPDLPDSTKVVWLVLLSPFEASPTHSCEHSTFLLRAICRDSRAMHSPASFLH